VDCWFTARAVRVTSVVCIAEVWTKFAMFLMVKEDEITLQLETGELITVG
jgi:hypothetical protein